MNYFHSIHFENSKKNNCNNSDMQKSTIFNPPLKTPEPNFHATSNARLQTKKMTILLHCHSIVATNLLVLAYLALWHIWLRRDARDKRITAAGRKNSWKTDSLEFVVLFSLLIFVKMIKKKRKAFLQEWHYYNNIDDMTLKWFRIVTMSQISNIYLIFTFAHCI